MDDSTKAVEFKNGAGERLKFDFHFNGNKLELSGKIDGEGAVLKAVRD